MKDPEGFNTETNSRAGERLREIAGRVRGGLEGVRDQLFATGLELDRRRSRAQLSYAELDGERFAYLERPGTDQTVVLLHGFTANKDIWLGYIRSLPRGLRVIAPDLKGHGDNAASLEENYGAIALLEHLTPFLDAIVGERFHLVGNSLGGLMAAGYASNAPERLLSLALFAPAGHFPSEKSECFRCIEAGNNPFLISSLADYKRFLKLTCTSDPPIPSIVFPVLAREQIARRELHSKMWDDLMSKREPLESRLEAITAPTLLVWGDDDKVLHPASRIFFAEHLRNVEVVRLSAGGHVPIFEHARQTADRYARFIAGRALAPSK